MVARRIGVERRSAHTQWPGAGDGRRSAIAQVVASLGQPMANNRSRRASGESRGAMLLDEIGPAILVTHGDGAVFAWVTAQERPTLVKASSPSNGGPAAQSIQGLDARI